MREKENLTLLGNQQTEYSMDYNPSVLEAFQNKHPENDYFVKFNCPEFTSLCPITGQPDFAATTFAIDPNEIKLVNNAAFHPLNSDNVPDAAFIALPTAVAVKYARNA